MKKIFVSPETIQEAKNIIDGVYHPLKGFLNKEELVSVLENMRLPSGEVWPMPIVLDIGGKNARELVKEKSVIISRGREDIILSEISVYEFDKNYLAKKLFGTGDISHPGAAEIMKLNGFFVGGKITAALTGRRPHELYYSPKDTKEIFRKNGWEHIAAFQTRNPPHRSHEHLQKKALDSVHGLFINPVIGPKKRGDFKDHHILEAYKIMIEKYHLPEKVHLGTLHTFMRYAGPKEALFHALVRRNFGCTHMIIGRDHAGVGNYYGYYDAQKIFDNFSKEELGIEIMKFENAAYCNACGDMVIGDECGHSPADQEHISGTDLRNRLLKDSEISDKIMRGEVVDYLLSNKEDLFFL